MAAHTATVPGERSGERPADPFVHEALLYADTAGYLDGTMKFVYEGISLDEPIMVAAPPRNVRLLRERLGAFSETVRFHDMTDAGRNPGRIIPWVLSMFMDAHPGRRVRIIGEPIWAGRSHEEYPACVQHEAMINVAFSGREAAILCPYDISALEPPVVADAHATHPVMIDGSGAFTSTGYDPYGVAAAYNVPLDEPPFGATTMRFEVGDLVLVRRRVAEVALEADLPPDRIGDLQSAVNELATNSVQHAGGSGTLRTWFNRERVVCEVRDFGQLTDPMAGRLRPVPGAAGRSGTGGQGRGLVMVHYLADLVQRHTSTTGTSTRVHVLR